MTRESRALVYSQLLECYTHDQVHRPAQNYEVPRSLVREIKMFLIEVGSSSNPAKVYEDSLEELK